MRVGGEVRHWEVGQVVVFDDSYEHEVWNETDEVRIVLLFQIDRPMRWLGRSLQSAFISLIKQTEYYREPKRRIVQLQDQFDARARGGKPASEQAGN